MINLTKIKLNIEKVNKSTLSNLRYETQSENPSLYYEKIFSNTVLKYNMTYVMANNQKKTFTKYFVLSSIINQETGEYQILDDVSPGSILEKKGFVKYIVFKNESLNSIFNSQASDEEKESIVTFLNNISPSQFVKIDRLAKKYFFKDLIENDVVEPEYRKKIIFEKIFNIVGKNLKRREISSVNKDFNSNMTVPPKVNDIQNIDQKLRYSNKSNFKNNVIIEKTHAKNLANIDQTTLNAVLEYKYSNCKKYNCNSTLVFDLKKNNDVIKIEKNNKTKEFQIEIDISDYLEKDENVSSIKVYKNINIEFYSKYYKQTNYNVYQKSCCKV